MRPLDRQCGGVKRAVKFHDGTVVARLLFPAINSSASAQHGGSHINQRRLEHRPLSVVIHCTRVLTQAVLR